MGATGGVFGLAAQGLFPSFANPPSRAAVAGMAVWLSDFHEAAITAVVMIFEMTLDYRIVTFHNHHRCTQFYGIRTLIQPQSIYTPEARPSGHPFQMHSGQISFT